MNMDSYNHLRDDITINMNQQSAPQDSGDTILNLQPGSLSASNSAHVTNSFVKQKCSEDVRNTNRKNDPIIYLKPVINIHVPQVPAVNSAQPDVHVHNSVRGSAASSAQANAHVHTHNKKQGYCCILCTIGVPVYLICIICCILLVFLVSVFGKRYIG